MRVLLPLTLLLVLSGCVQRMGVEPEIFQMVRSNDVIKLVYELENGADPNSLNGVGDPLVYVAAGPKGGLAVMRELLKAGADPNVLTSKGRSALHNAASWCSPDIVVALLTSGANPHLTNAKGLTAIDATCKAPQNRREQVVGILREAMSK